MDVQADLSRNSVSGDIGALVFRTCYYAGTVRSPAPMIRGMHRAVRAAWLTTVPRAIDRPPPDTEDAGPAVAAGRRGTALEMITLLRN
jgi:hypothetical protein